MSREPLQDFKHDTSAYERPTQNWICGWAREGQPCRVGPSSRGSCRARYECKPVLKAGGKATPEGKGGRWHCTRPRSAGGPCELGPFPDGKCTRPIPRCQPYRSLRARRGLVSRAAATLTLGLAVLLFGGPYLQGLRTSALSPGGLSAGHRIIGSCATCHEGAGERVTLLAGPAVTLFAPRTNPRLQCTTCHRADGDHALRAHGAAPDRLAAVTRRSGAPAPIPWSSPTLALAAVGPGVPFGSEGELPCSTCHTDHRGRTFDPTAMGNGRCQACHAARFGTFREHPEFTDFPAGRAASDYFEHGLHEKEMKGLRCGDCHAPDGAGARILVGTYRAMCADCHQDEMRNLTPAFTGAAPPPLGRLTRFDHAPHLSASCTTCHKTGAAANFSPMSRTMCADCHAPARANTTCLTCHRYHDRRLGLASTPAP